MDELIGKEVFVIVPEEDTITEIAFYETVEELNEHLVLIEPLDEPETKVLHGILTKAETIPAHIKSDKCYVIVISAVYSNNTVQGVIYQSECDGDPDILANDVEESIGDINSGVMMNPTIDEILILYGYEASTGLCLNIESLDEEIISRCKTIGSKAEELRTEYIK